MATQISTSTSNAALGYSPQNKVSVLCDGTLITGLYDGATNKVIPYICANPSAGSPTWSSLTPTTALQITSSTATNFDIFVLNNGTTTSDVWFLLSSNSGTTGVAVAHVVYTASGASWGTWDGPTAITLSGTSGGTIGSLVWTGTYLIAAFRYFNGTNYQLQYSYTTTKAGTSGWQTVAGLEATALASGTGSHRYVNLHHDTSQAVTYAIYTTTGTGANGTEKIYYRALLDSNSPAIANWTAETVIYNTAINAGSAQIAAAFDHANARIHIVWADSTAATTKSPGYITGTISGTTPTWGSAIGLGTAATTTGHVGVGVDASGNAWVGYIQNNANSNPDLWYTKLASPNFTSGSTPTNLTSTGATASAITLPHLPTREQMPSGYAPVTYQKNTASPFAVMYDNSIPTSVTSTRTTTSRTAVQSTATRTVSSRTAVQAQVTRQTSSRTAVISSGQRTTTAQTEIVAQATRTVTSQTSINSPIAARTTTSRTAVIAQVTRQTSSRTAVIQSLTRQLSSRTAVQSQGNRTVTSRTEILAQATRTITSQTAISATNGTGIGGVTVSTGTQTWNLTGNGYGTGDVAGTETDIAYTDSSGSGWAVGAIPAYGGFPVTSWYEINANSPTLPAKTGSGNQTTLLTTKSGGWVHIITESGTTGLPTGISASNFASSEDVKFQNAGHFVESAPSGTTFRRYYTATGDSNDSNGIGWTGSLCIYPGDPGFQVVTHVQTNNNASSLPLAEWDVEVIGSLFYDGGTPAGVWNAANGFYGQLGSASVSGWPTGGASVLPDYVGITPDVTSGQHIGVVGVIYENLAAAPFNWTGVNFSAQQSASSGTVPGRLKAQIQTKMAASLAAGSVYTYHTLHALVRNLTPAKAAAIAADYRLPGTPSTTAGSYTAFRVDERAFEFAASASGTLAATLDLSPTNVTTRFKPVLKVTGWTSGAQPVLTWGGSSLVANQDYRYTVDTANNVLYLQLYFDVVSSGATTGQRNNAALAVSPQLGTRTTSSRTAITQQLTRTLSSRTAVRTSGTRTATSRTAVQSQGLRSVSSQTEIRATPSRQTTSRTAIQAQMTRTLSSRTAVLTTGQRSTTSRTAVQSSGTRTVSSQTAINAPLLRHATSQTAIQARASRVLASRTAIITTGMRTTTSRTAVQSHGTRSVSSQTAINAPYQRHTASQTAISAQAARTLAARTAVRGSASRTVSSQTATYPAGVYTRQVTSQTAVVFIRPPLLVTLADTEPLLVTLTSLDSSGGATMQHVVGGAVMIRIGFKDGLTLDPEDPSSVGTFTFESPVTKTQTPITPTRNALGDWVAILPTTTEIGVWDGSYLSGDTNKAAGRIQFVVIDNGL